MAQNTSNLANMDSTASIVQFLQRPVKLDHFQLKPGNDSVKPLKQFVLKDPQTPIRSWNIPQDILDKGQKMYKVANQYLFKADAHVKLVINTNPFVAARFYLTYSPYEDNVSIPRKQIYSSRAGVTAYPGVEIDVQLNNTVEMTIPFASYKEAYVLNTTAPENFVKLYLYGITPVLGTTTAPTVSIIDCTLYAWFENIVINLPTSKAMSLGPQVKRVEIVKEIEVDKTKDQIETLKRSNPSAYKYITNLLKQSLRSTRSVDEVDTFMQVQAENLQQGIISDIAGVIKSGAEGISNKVPIPIVKEVAEPIKWIAGAVEAVAKIFGFSRPQTEAQMCAFQNMPGRAYTHYSAIDQSVSLAFQQDNELERPHNVFPSALDEMDLEYVCNNPAVKEVISWQVGSIKTLAIIPVGIGPFNRNELEAKTFDLQPWEGNYFDANLLGLPGGVHNLIWTKKNTSNPTSGCGINEGYKMKLVGKYKVGAGLLDTAPCEYVSQLFQRWRATMCFKISIVKTAFHSGRLEIFYDPGPFVYKDGTIVGDKAAYDDIDTTNNYKYILDLTNDTEVTIKIPFVTETMYKSTIAANSRASRLGDFASAPFIEDVFDSMIGSLIIRPVSALLAPETVAQEVKIIVWKWAEDVDLQIPQNSTQKDLIVYDPAQASQIPDPGLSFSDLGSIVGTGSYIPCQWDCVPTQMQINIGNIANQNVITFLNSNDFLSANMNAATLCMGEKVFNLRTLLRIFRPWKELKMGAGSSLFLNYQDDTSGKSQVDEKTVTDFSSFLSYMYRFMRGGVRYKIFDKKLNSDNMLRSSINFYSKLPFVNGVGPTHITYSNLNPVHEVNVPFYCKYRKLPISFFEEGIVPQTIINSDKETDALVMRAGNDDLTFGWLMGTPQLTTGLGTFEMVSYQLAPENCRPWTE